MFVLDIAHDLLSRISAQKGPHLAIELARRLGMRLIIAGNVHPLDSEYFQSEVLPNVDGDMILYAGEVGYYRKRELMLQARCLLAPLTWDEPFGLFMVEAMACGTPVVAFNRGAAPEVVKHGETGFIVTTLHEMAEAVAQVEWIDPRRCREHVQQSFDVSRMVDDYLAAYDRILSEAKGTATPKKLSAQLCP